jgi:integrase
MKVAIGHHTCTHLRCLEPEAPCGQVRCDQAACSAGWFFVTTCCHTFRATGITTYLQNGGTIEHAQQIANHESPRTTKLYDRTNDAISLDEIERILI